MQNEVTKLKEEIKKLKIDFMTGFLTQTAFRIAIENKRFQTYIVIDVNGLKKVNDKFGHLEGDKLIKRVASEIKKKIGDRGIIGRNGGDEFYVASNLPINNFKNLTIQNASVGISSTSFNKADENMYINKRRSKSSLNKIRRLFYRK